MSNIGIGAIKANLHLANNPDDSLLYSSARTVVVLPFYRLISVFTFTFKQSLNNRNTKTIRLYLLTFWDLKDNHNIVPTLSWSIVKHAKIYTINAHSWQLCLQEKFEILNYPLKTELLNIQSELISKYHQMNKFLLANYKSKD